MIEMHCETDFVAKTAQFMDGIQAVLNTIHSDKDLQVGVKDSRDGDLLKKLTKEKKLIKPLDPDASS